MNTKEILENYFKNPDDQEAKRKLKNFLISKIVFADTASEVNGAKFLLENIFDWKNDGAVKNTQGEEIIKVNFVSNMKEEKDNVNS